MPNWPFLLAFTPMENQGFFTNFDAKLALSTSFDTSKNQTQYQTR
jgi:hypothetical protein